MAEYSGLGAIRHLDMVIILCDNLERMRNFYANVLEFHIEYESPGLNAGFRVGSSYVMLRPRGRIYDGHKVAENSASIQLSFRVPPADVDLAYETLKGRDVEIIERPTNQDWLHRTLFFKDPENNILEIYADIHPREAASYPSKVHERKP